MSLPTGTITFLITDIEGSTRLFPFPYPNPQRPLGEEAFSTAWAEGRAMTREEVIENTLKRMR